MIFIPEERPAETILSFLLIMNKVDNFDYLCACVSFHISVRELALAPTYN